MKAICVVRDSELEVRDLPQPSAPADEHLLVEMQANAINPGDKYFLANPIARAALISGTHDIWGASGAGRVIAVGKNVPEHYKGKQVAIYRSLVRTPETLGLWCEVAQVHHLTSVVLPDNVDAGDYCGSLVNVMTAFAFISQIITDGHHGVIATAGGSATGMALLELARYKKIPAIAIVRSDAQKEALDKRGFENVLVSGDAGFDLDFKALAEKLSCTAVFEGVGGEIVGRIVPLLPMHSTLYFYGFLAGPATFNIQSRMILEKSLTLKGFSNFMTETVQNRKLLASALAELSAIIEAPTFRTKLGTRYTYDEIEKALHYQGESGSKCVLVP